MKFVFISLEHSADYDVYVLCVYF